jgi:ABC-type branched-subunit amino acid transport system ATPase component
MPAASVSTARHHRAADLAAQPLGLARSFQITSLFLDFTALDNVALAVQAHAGHSFRFWQRRAGKRVARPARAALARRACASRRRPVAALSHGEHRQLEIAMALATSRACCCSTSRWRAWGRRNPRAW